MGGRVSVIINSALSPKMKIMTSKSIKKTLILFISFLLLVSLINHCYTGGIAIKTTVKGTLHKTVFSLQDFTRLCQYNGLPSVMISMILHNHDSFGADDHGRERNFASVLKMIASVNYPSECISLSFLISELEEYEEVGRILRYSLRSAGFQRATIVYQSFLLSVARANDYSIHRPRKGLKLMAEAKNYLIHSSLSEEDSVFVLDADVIQVPANGLFELVRSGGDIITARCAVGNVSNYDLGAWVGDPHFDEDRWIHRQNSTHLNDYEASRYDLIPLDSVGSTNLFIKAELIRRGLRFPPLFIVGTKWSRKEGYDGVDTEGICYAAKAMGSQCWGMPHLEFRHSPKI